MRNTTKNTAKRNNNKAANTAPAAANTTATDAVTEAKPDASALRAERIAAERASVAALYAGFDANRASVPVKPVSAFKLAATTAHPISRKPSQRQAAALAVAVAASGKKLIDGVSVARVFDHNGVNSAIENGVLRDAVSSGLARVSGDNAATETITIVKAAPIVSLLGEKLLKQAKLI